jgi:hypothetical protein
MSYDRSQKRAITRNNFPPILFPDVPEIAQLHSEQVKVITIQITRQKGPRAAFMIECSK